MCVYNISLMIDKVVFNDGEANRDSKYVRFDLDEWIIRSEGTSRVTISNVGVEDEGRYRCQVLGLHTTEPADTMITVEGKSISNIWLGRYVAQGE